MALLNHEDYCLFLFQLLFIVMNDLIANFVRKYSACMSSYIPALVCVSVLLSEFFALGSDN